MQLGLQTAPVLLLFQPTHGPHAVADSAPLRYDFTNGYAIPQIFSAITSNTTLVPNLLSRFTPGLPVIYKIALTPNSIGPSIGSE